MCPRSLALPIEPPFAPFLPPGRSISGGSGACSPLSRTSARPPATSRRPWGRRQKRKSGFSSPRLSGMKVSSRDHSAPSTTFRGLPFDPEHIELMSSVLDDVSRELGLATDNWRAHYAARPSVTRSITSRFLNLVNTLCAPVREDVTASKFVMRLAARICEMRSRMKVSIRSSIRSTGY